MPYELSHLIEIIETLRGPDGCPWDKAQTIKTMAPNLLEEVYEVLEAIDTGKDESLNEELGDLLFVVLLTCNIADSDGHLNKTDIYENICRKMIRRHPHVFGDANLSLNEVRKSWADIKAREKPKSSRLDGIPNDLPALQKASRLGQKASTVGFDWPTPDPVLKQVEAEIEELKGALVSGDKAAITHEIGDILLSMASLSRHLRIDPETALRLANHRFTERFHHMEETVANRDQKLSDLSSEELEALWEHAKVQIKTSREST